MNPSNVAHSGTFHAAELPWLPRSRDWAGQLWPSRTVQAGLQMVKTADAVVATSFMSDPFSGPGPDPLSFPLAI